MLNFMRDTSSQTNSEFHRACLRGDATAALRCLDEGADIDTVRSDMPAILVAVHRKHFDLAIELLNRGVNPNVFNNFETSPLHFAAEYGHEELTKRLLDRAALVFRRDQVGDTPAHYAIKSKSLPVMQLLIDRGAELNMQNDAGDTVMHLAAKEGPIEMIELLLKVPGIVVDLPNEMGQTAIDLAYDPEVKAKMEAHALNSRLNKAHAPSSPDVVDVADMGKVPEAPVEEAPKKRRIMKA